MATSRLRFGVNALTIKAYPANGWKAKDEVKILTRNQNQDMDRFHRWRLALFCCVALTKESRKAPSFSYGDEGSGETWNFSSCFFIFFP